MINPKGNTFMDLSIVPCDSDCSPDAHVIVRRVCLIINLVKPCLIRLGIVWAREQEVLQMDLKVKSKGI